MLFKGNAPNLRAFSLSRVVIPWPLVPRGLTQLKIAGPDKEDHFPGELDQLINVLINCPALETLSLEFYLPSRLTQFSCGRTIHLPQLSRLCLCSSTPDVLNMFKMLKLPSLTTLHLDCISKISIFTHNDSETESLLLCAISAHFQRPAPVEFKSLAATIRGLTTFLSTLQNRQAQIFEDDIVAMLRLFYHSTQAVRQTLSSKHAKCCPFQTSSLFLCPPLVKST